jgi:hypothetical protein
MAATASSAAIHPIAYRFNVAYSDAEGDRDEKLFARESWRDLGRHFAHRRRFHGYDDHIALVNNLDIIVCG